MQALSRSWFAVPASTFCISVVLQSQKREVHAAGFPRASWEVLEAYAADQRGEVAAGRGPRRAPEIDHRYQRYFAWSKERGVNAPDYLAMTARWKCVAGGPWVALEPNIVPYHLDAGIEHWNLWYHPSTTPGTMDLDMQAGSIVEFASTGKRGQVKSVRGWAADPTCVIEVFAEDAGDTMVVTRSELRPVGWAAILQHLRVFLLDVQDDEVVIFQNVPEMRSVPQIVHAHVFIRPKTNSTRDALKRHKREWTLVSPWAEHERLGGRGSEVGFDE